MQDLNEILQEIYLVVQHLDPTARAGRVAGTAGTLQTRVQLDRHGRRRAASDELGLEEQLLGLHGRALDLPVSIATAARPIASIGCRTVVSGGSVQFMNAESS